MWVKRTFITLGIMAGILAGIALCVLIYFPATSDAELLESLFPTDFPGYSNIEIISSEGEGMRRIPRRIEVLVQMEGYPQAVICPGEVFLWAGDPMGFECALANPAVRRSAPLHGAGANGFVKRFCLREVS